MKRYYGNFPLVENSPIIIPTPITPSAPKATGKKSKYWRSRREKHQKYLVRRKCILRNMTPAELQFWNLLGPFQQYFQPQYYFHPYKLDFYCRKLKLDFEIDGSSHRPRARYDLRREAYLLMRGVKTVRLTNVEVLNFPDDVRARLRVHLILSGIEDPISPS